MTTETPVKVHDKAVENGTLRSVSPSQLTTYLDCPRKWAYDKVFNRGKAFASWLTVGTDLHTEMEEWFLHGKEPTHLSAKAALYLPEVPDRGEDIFIESPADYVTNLFMSGVPVKGRVDFRVGPRDTDTFRVLDWKSCKTYQYVHTADSLSRNPQGIIYLQYGFTQHLSASYGTFGHVYLKTSTPGAKAVVTDRLSAARVQEVYSGLEEVVSEMKVAAGAQDPEDVRYNKAACGKFGGCQFKSICSAADGVKSKSTFDMEALLEPVTSPVSSLSDFMKRTKGTTKPVVSARAVRDIERHMEIGQFGLGGSPAILDRKVHPTDPHLPVMFPLTYELVTDSPINPPDAREPYPVTPWEPEA